MKKLLSLALASLLFINVAIAGQATLKWTNPTTYTDGTTLPMSDVASLKIMYGKCADGKTLPQPPLVQTVPKTNNTLPTSATVTNLDDSPATGTPVIYCFAMSTVSVANGESVRTSVVNQTMDQHAPPSPPTGLVTVAQTVYMEVRGTDRFSLVAVGTVPLATSCDATQSVNGFYVVPNKLVTWSGSVRPPVVVAKCG